MQTQLLEAGQALQAKRQAAKDFLDSFEARGDAQAKVMSSDDLTKFNTLMDEVNDLGAKYDQLNEAAQKAENLKIAMSDSREAGLIAAKSMIDAGQSFGDMAMKRITQRMRVEGSVKGDFELDGVDTVKLLRSGEIKTVMGTGASGGLTGWAPEVLRDPGVVVPYISRPPELIDFLRMIPTTQNSLKWMKQTTRTNSTASANEGSAVAESVFVWTQQTGEVNKLGHYINVSEEQLEDEPMVRGLLDQDLILGVRQIVDYQVTVGDGTGQDLVGFTNLSSIDTQAKGSDTQIDALFKALNGLEIDGNARPNLYVLHPRDWQTLVLARTADGTYLLGNPTDSAMRRCWGLPVVTSRALTAGTGLCIDTNYFIVRPRTGVQVAITNSDSTNFRASVYTIRATIRVGFQSLRDEAACKITGL